MLPEPATLPQLLRRNHERYADKLVVVAAEDSLSHADLDDRSHELARALVAAGVEKSARVGLMAPNGVDWAVAAAAVMRIGSVLVPLSTLLQAPELAAQLESADVTHLIAVREFRGRSYFDDIEKIAPGTAASAGSPRCSAALPALMRVWPLDDLPRVAADTAVVTALEDGVRPSDDLVLMFTSGSRGAPKGVVHTHAGALLATESGLASRCIGEDERLYIPMPFFWTGGFNGGLLSVLLAGATLLTEAIPQGAATIALLETHGATLFRGWPDQAARLAADPAFGSAALSSLRPASLAAVLPASQRPAPGARANLFGMTETAGPYCGERLDRDLPAEKFGSCGRPFRGLDARIVDPETGSVVTPGEPGEIRLRGRRVMRTIHGRLRESFVDADGFYLTADLGVVDADGYLWYRGRLDDMVKVSGATVFPSEVEAALRTIAGVRQAYVTDVLVEGVATIAALVITAEPLAKVVDEAAGQLSAFKVPSVWLASEAADSVPLSATSKVDKPGLQALLLRDGVRMTKSR